MPTAAPEAAAASDPIIIDAAETRPVSAAYFVVAYQPSLGCMNE